MQCKQCHSQNMTLNGDMIHDKDKEEFKEYADLELWTCLCCGSTFAYKKVDYSFQK